VISTVLARAGGCRSAGAGSAHASQAHVSEAHASEAEAAEAITLNRSLSELGTVARDAVG